MKTQIAAIFLLLTPGVFAGLYGGGSGTIDDPFQIWTVAHFTELGATPQDYDKAFILMDDLDLEGILYEAAPIAPDHDPDTWGLQGTKFNGRFDGNLHTIRNLSVTHMKADYIGLFGELDPDADVRNLMLENVILINRHGVGGITASSYGTIENCHVNGIIGSGYIAGGIVGYLDNGSVRYCTSRVMVVPKAGVPGQQAQCLGGLVGMAHFGTISDCWSIMTMMLQEQAHAVGGLVGDNREATIEHCWAQATVHNDKACHTGGLCGINAGTLRNCVAVDTDIQTTFNCIGGLAGSNESLITQCIAEGAIKGHGNCGGLIGHNRGYVIDSYTSVSVNAEGVSGGFVAGNHYGILRSYSLGAARCRTFKPGGFVGFNTGLVDRCFWDIETSGLLQSQGGEGLTTQRLKEMAAYQGWGDGVWVIEEKLGYPKLMWEQTPGFVIEDVPAVYGGGQGTPEDPFLIRTPEHLMRLGDYPQDLTKCYKLMNDLDMSGVDFDGIGFGFGFEGTFDGDGHTIGNLTMIGELDYTGLFCVVLKKGTVKNLHLVNFDITGKCKSGGLAGKNEGTIIHCTAQGRLTMPDDGRERCTYGGLIGYNYGQVTACRSDVDLLAAGSDVKSFGGLVGINMGVIRQSAAAGSITVTGKNACGFGGFVGRGGYDSKIYDCCSTVDISVSGLSCHCFGGFAGNQWYRTRIERSYCSGAMVVGEASILKNCGGFAGSNGHVQLGNANVIDCFWDSERSGRAESIGLNYTENAAPAGLTTQQLMDIATYAQASWSVDSEPNDHATWIVLPDSLPQLSCFVDE